MINAVIAITAFLKIFLRYRWGGTSCTYTFNSGMIKGSLIDIETSFSWSFVVTSAESIEVEVGIVFLKTRMCLNPFVVARGRKQKSNYLAMRTLRFHRSLQWIIVFKVIYILR